MKLRYFLGAALLSLGVAANSSHGDEVRLNPEDYICPTDIVEECYPKVFVPTTEFQVIRPEQAIPKGLHVRVDMQTGEKEAKLYDPLNDTDEVNAIEVLPDEPLRDEPPTQNYQDQAQKVLNEMRKAKASRGESIKPPPGSSGLRETFQQHVQTLKDSAQSLEFVSDEGSRERLSGALEELEDLCHDVYWGQELLKDQELLNGLPKLDLEGHPLLGSQVHLLLGTALQNNAAALDLLEAYIEELQSDYMDWVMKGFGEPETPSVYSSRIISHISAILPRERFFDLFLASYGPTALRKLAGKWHTDERILTKTLNLIQDHIVSTAGRIRMEQRAQELKRKTPGLENVLSKLETPASLDTPSASDEEAQICRGAYDSFRLRSEVPYYLKMAATGHKLSDKDRVNAEASVAKLTLKEIPSFCHPDGIGINTREDYGQVRIPEDDMKSEL